MLPVWCSAMPRAGAAVNCGSSPRARLTLTPPPAALEPFDGRDEGVRQQAAVEQFEEGDLGVDRADDRRSVHTEPVGERDAGDRAAGHVDAGDGGAGHHLGAVGLGGAAAGGGEAAHAAARETPAADVPVAAVSHGKVQEHVRRARLRRPGPRPEGRRHRRHRLDLVRLEPVAQDVLGARREEARQVGDAADAEAARAPGDLEKVRRDRPGETSRSWGESAGRAARPRRRGCPATPRSPPGVGILGGERAMLSRQRAASSWRIRARPSGKPWKYGPNGRMRSPCRSSSSWATRRRGMRPAT